MKVSEKIFLNSLIQIEMCWMTGNVDSLSSVLQVISTVPEIFAVMLVQTHFCCVSASAFVHVDLQLLYSLINTVSITL